MVLVQELSWGCNQDIFWSCNHFKSQLELKTPLPSSLMCLAQICFQAHLGSCWQASVPCYVDLCISCLNVIMALQLLMIEREGQGKNQRLGGSVQDGSQGLSVTKCQKWHSIPFAIYRKEVLKFSKSSITQGHGFQEVVVIDGCPSICLPLCIIVQSQMTPNIIENAPGTFPCLHYDSGWQRCLFLGHWLSFGRGKRDLRSISCHFHLHLVGQRRFHGVWLTSVVQEYNCCREACRGKGSKCFEQW